jgi:hypothetical protein
MITLIEAKKQYDGEWIAFLIQQDGRDKEPCGEILDHDTDKRELHKKLRNKKIKEAYITFAGPVVKPGYEVLF